MTVILCKECIEYRQAVFADNKSSAVCSICAGHLWPPFIFWLCQGQMRICRSCIEGVGKGLMADLIQAQAIIALQDLYPDHTLERQHLPMLIRKLKDEHG